MPTSDRKKAARSLPSNFKKSIVFIYTLPNIRPLARKIWNVLACIDQKGLTPNKKHEINFKELCELIHYKSHDYTCIKSALLELQVNTIQSIDSVTNDEIIINEKWLNTTYFESLEISQGVIHYQYSELLLSELKNPKIFAILDLSSLRNIPNNKAIILFEIAGRYVMNHKYPGYTPKWTLFHFRSLMAANAKTYNQFKHLNRKLIKPCLQTINDLTHLEITLIPERTRPVRVIKFHVTVKSISSFVDVKEKNLTVEMIALGISSQKTNKYLDLYGENIIQKALQISEEKSAQGAIKGSKAGYFVGVLKQLKPEVEANKELHDLHKKAFKNELVELRERIEDSKSTQKRIPEINGFLKTLKLTEFKNLQDNYINEISFCLPEFRDPNNWIDRICMSPVHLEIWLDHVEDYQKQSVRGV